MSQNQNQEKNTWAIAGLIFSLLVPFFGFWLSIGAFSKARNECKGNGLLISICGICIGAIATLGLILIYLHFVCQLI